MPRIILYIFIIFFSFYGSAAAQKGSPTHFGGDIPSAENYGMVYLNNYSRKAGVVPVIFDHWLHRAKFTCRICHIDIGKILELFLLAAPCPPTQELRGSLHALTHPLQRREPVD